MGFKRSAKRRASREASAPIRCVGEFQDYIYEKSSSDIFDHELSPSTSICGIKHASDTLLILPRTSDLRNISQYRFLEFVQVNNYPVGDPEMAIFRDNQASLSNVTSLCFWNATLADLGCVQAFPNVRHLFLAHLLRDGFSFAGLEHLTRLETLCLLKTPKLRDLRFLEHVGSDQLANLSIENARHLKSTAGIETLAGLTTLSLVGAESSYSMDNLSGLDLLPELAEVELVNIFIPPDELSKALNGVERPISLKMSPNQYEANVYKRLGSELRHVQSDVFHPTIQHGTRIIPVGKGKRNFDTSDSNAAEKLERLQADWDSA